VEQAGGVGGKVEADIDNKSNIFNVLADILELQLDSFAVTDSVREAVLYAMGSGGKLLRPRLLLGAHQDLVLNKVGAGSQQAPLRAALAVELLHAASLVHDDLPALDNDDFRRGQPSCHRRFSESTAILAGDLMVGVSFSLLGDEMSVRCVPSLSRAWVLLCDGQQRDLEELGSVTEADEMVARKTGALFQASTEMGAVIAGAAAELVEQYGRFGLTFGRAFQALDDLVDGDQPRMFGSTEKYLSTHRAELFDQLSELEVALGRHSALRAIAETVFNREISPKKGAPTT
jgi:geranylgeranyl pyrophosphate synthase